MSPFFHDTPARRPRGLIACLAALGLALAADAAQLTLRWSDTSNNERGFAIERATAATGPFVQIATTPADATTYVDQGVAYASTYHYRIRAFNLTGESTYSNTTSAVTPPPPNTAPTITAIADQVIQEDTTSAALAFSIADAETAATALSVTVTSSNSTLVPAANITLAGTGTNRTITLHPAANQSGTTTITITVSDGSLSTSSSFVVTVSPVNDLPQISSVAARTVQAGTSSGAIAFSVSDIETAAASLTVTATSSQPAILPDSALILGGSGSSRTLTFTPPATTGGTATVTLRVSDGAATAATTFVVTVTAANTPPTVSALAPQTIPMNGVSSALAFTIGDSHTPAASLAVTATSSNTALVATAGLTLGGTDGQRTIVVRPEPDTGGTSTITIRVSDGTFTTTSTFVVTVPQNTAPTVSAIADRTVATATSSGSIAFTIADLETPTANLSVSAISSNQTLLPDAALFLGGAGASRTLTFTPPSTLTGGTTTVTIRVADSSLTTSTSFAVTVDATNKAPTITPIAAQNIAMNTSAGPLAFTISDTQTPADSLTLITNASNQALVPLSNITLQGSGNNRTITVRPVANSTGWSTIWVKVSDGALSQTISFVVNVSATLTYQDVGTPTLAGSQTTSGTTIAITAGGTDIWGGTDQFRFGHQPLQGDSEMTVKLASLTNSHAWAKAGLMYRGSTDANAAYVFVCLTPANGVALQYRTAPGTAALQKYTAPATLPRWLKLMRSGNTFYAFQSVDGAAWDLVDFVTVALPDSVPAGLAVTSHAETVSTTATFEGLAVD